MKNFKTLLVLFLAFITLIGCSSSEEEMTPNNKVIIDGETYSVKTAVIDSFNGKIAIDLVNKSRNEINEFISGKPLTNANFFKIVLRTNEFEEKSYYGTDVNYDFMINGTLANGEYDNEETILESDSDDNLNVTINEITDTTINLEFFIRKANGKIAEGTYDGAYILWD